jgi:hypothetical protein
MPVRTTKLEREAVARLAYELYLRRDREDGNAIEDWLTAERMLKETLKRRRKISQRPRVLRRAEDMSRR